MAVIIPFVKPIFKRGSKLKLALISIFICESLEVISTIVGLPNSGYRLLAIRYFFLIYLGWLWVKDGIVLNTKTILLSLLSMCTIVYFAYLYSPIEPWFYDTPWVTHRWPCYFYVSTLLCGILYWIYEKTKKVDIIERTTKLLAKCSYEIFLLQMLACAILPKMNFIENKLLSFGLRFTLIWSFSIIGGYYFNDIYNKILKR